MANSRTDQRNSCSPESTPSSKQETSYFEAAEGHVEKALPSSPGNDSPLLEKFTHNAATLQLYPLSSILIVLWVLFILGMMLSFEMAVRYTLRATTPDVPWWIKRVPAGARIIFGQGHASITAFHLSRLAISALQRENTSPLTWRELIWSADRAWQGPVGMVVSFYDSVKARIRLSRGFYLFVTVISLALVTPFVLSQTYINNPVYVTLPMDDSRPWLPTPNRIAEINSFSQVSAGDSLWNSGRSAESLFNTSIYYPHNATRTAEGSQNLFFSGDVLGMNGVIPGILYNGSCSVFSGDIGSQPLQFHDGLAQITHICAKLGFAAPQLNSTVGIGTFGSNDRTEYTWCGKTDPWYADRVAYNTTRPLDNTSSGLAFFRVTVNSPQPSSNDGVITSGIIRCESTYQFGYAAVNGTSGTMAEFTPSPFPLRSDWSALGTSSQMLHPIPAALSALSQGGFTAENPGAATSDPFLAGLEANKFKSLLRNKLVSQTNASVPLSMTSLAQRIWIGTTHMAISAPVWGTSNDLAYNGTRQIVVAGYTRPNKSLFILLIILLVSWIGLLALLTIWMFRPTFTGNLGSYTIARLILDRPDLVEGHCAGDLDVNPRLNEAFIRVGDTKDGLGEVGHISVGGEGLLRVNRHYAGRFV